MGAISHLGEEIHRRPTVGPGANWGRQAASGRTRCRLGGLPRWCHDPHGPPKEGTGKTSCERGDGPSGHLLQRMQAEEPGIYERVRDSQI